MSEAIRREALAHLATAQALIEQCGSEPTEIVKLQVEFHLQAAVVKATLYGSDASASMNR